MDTFTDTSARGPKPEIFCVTYDESRSKPRQDRTARGLAILDAYEDDMRTKDLGYDYDKQEEEPMWSRYFGKAMFMTQVSLLIGALIMFSGAFTAERNGFDYADQVRFGEMDPDVLYIPYGCAAMTGVTAVVGCFGIVFRKPIVLTVYVICLGLTLALAVGGAMQASADHYNVFNYAKRQWWEMTYQQEQLFQHRFLCCNFDNIDPCCRWAVGEGACENEYMCFDRVGPHLTEQFKLISSTAAIHAVICAVSFCLALGLVIVLQIKKCANGQYDGDIPLRSLMQALTPNGKGKRVGDEERSTTAKETEMQDLGY